MRRFGLKNLMAMGMWSTARIAHGRFGGPCDRKWPTYSNSVGLSPLSTIQISVDQHLLMVESSCGLLARYDDREPEPTKGDYSHGLRLQCSQLGLSRGWSEAGEFFVSCHRSLLDSLSPGARILDCPRNGIRCD